MILNHSQSISGYIKWAVINQDGTVDKKGEHKNLILDQGLDQVAEYYYGQLSVYCAVGTGNTSPAASDVGLVAESARTNNYLTSPTGSCGSTWTDATTVVYKRTYDFPKGTLNGTYYEVGFSPIDVAGNNLFSRALFQVSGSPAGVTVNSEQILRVVYELTVSISPSTSSAGTFDITNIGTIGYTHSVQKNSQTDYLYTEALSGIDASGLPSFIDSTIYTMALEPSVNEATSGADFALYVLASGEAFTLSAAGSSVSDIGTGVSVKSVRSAYVSGNNYVDRVATYGVNDANYTHYGYLIGAANNSYDQYSPYAVRIDDADVYTKANTHELEITFRLSWSRV